MQLPLLTLGFAELSFSALRARLFARSDLYGAQMSGPQAAGVHADTTVATTAASRWPQPHGRAAAIRAGSCRTPTGIAGRSA
jgi:hypothetical protein